MWFHFMVVTVALVFLGLAGLGVALKMPGATSARAEDNMDVWVKEQGIQVKRKSCYFDSDNDGNSSCTVVTADDEKIFLQCSSGLINNAIGATGCKEVQAQIKVQ